MKLEQQVCSLELAKRLKELGVKQESYFVYDQSMDTGDIRITIEDCEPVLPVCSAFTVAELGEMLPLDHTFQGDTWLAFYRYPNGHGVQMETLNRDFSTSILHESFADTEADARAKMLIYLLENQLI